MAKLRSEPIYVIKRRSCLFRKEADTYSDFYIYWRKRDSGTYLKTVQAELSCIFNHAVNFYELACNPARKAGPLGCGQADEMLFGTKDEYLQFIPNIADKPYSYYAFELLYWCGMRLGELLALTLADFNFATNVFSITKPYQRIKGEDIVTKPKTRSRM